MKQMLRQKQKQFLSAAESGEFHLLREILKEYSETEIRDYYGSSALMLAAKTGNSRIVKYLIEAGANIHARNYAGDNALSLASREAHPRVVQLLLNHGAQYEGRPIGNRRALVELQPDENSILKTIYLNSTSDPTWEPWNTLKEPSKLRVQRIRKLLCKVVELLISSGADVNSRDNDNNSFLYILIQSDLHGCIPVLLKHTPNLNAINNLGETPLTEAIMRGKEDIALLLLESGADPNDGNWAKPIHLVASSYLSPGFLKKLIAAGADVNIKDKYGMTALFMTLRRWRDNQEITQILLDAGADINIEDGRGFTLFDHAMMAVLDLEDGRKYSTPNCPDDFTPYQFPFNPSHARFIRAAKDGDSEALRSQLENPIPDRIKTLALFETLSQWKYECCQLLLDNGADPNARGIEENTPLASAAAELETDISALLHSYGAELELPNGLGQKPLFFASQGGCGDLPEDMPEQKRMRTVTLLLGRGAEVDGADDEGWTPLRQSVFAAQDIDLARLLLQHGANPDHKDKFGVSPLQLADQHCSDAIVQLLRQHVKK